MYNIKRMKLAPFWAVCWNDEYPIFYTVFGQKMPALDPTASKSFWSGSVMFAIQPVFFNPCHAEPAYTLHLQTV